ncbi:hypothetical protein MKW98_009631 [Papaver atlanticum]|uniref:Uncharacterized protein n=1 Tax=Papaver atlanticum TaxID=357466 RepID=A0AAD4SC94_9MAGN|nr:hypothetical protein MKW98_009631 [Papaver atlanticum]
MVQSWKYYKNVKIPTSMSKSPISISEIFNLLLQTLNYNSMKETLHAIHTDLAVENHFSENARVTKVNESLPNLFEVLSRLEPYGIVVKLKKTKTTSPAWQCNWCLQDACEVPSRSATGSRVAEVKGLHLLMSSTFPGDRREFLDIL